MILRGPATFREPRRVLFIQLRRIGDVLLSTPALRALAARFPDAVVDFLTESPASEALFGHPLVNRLWIAPRDKSVRSFLRIARELRHARYDWVMDFFTNPRSAQFAFATRAPLRMGLDRRGRRWAYTHHLVEEAKDRAAYAVDLRLNALALLGVPAAGRELEIFADRVSPADVSRVETLLREVDSGQPLVAVTTGSANPAKRYPSDLTARVIALLRERGCAVVLTAGPGENEFAEEILALLPQPVPFLAEAHVPTLAALYRHAVLYVGPDSGPKHVAVACGIPTVTIFGPGCPTNWNDPHNARNALLAAPCDVRPDCVEAECARRQCLRKIPPEDVVHAASMLLK